MTGCGSDDPDSRLDSINALMAKDFPLTDQQRTDIDKLVAEGKQLANNGKPEQANAVLDEAIAILEFAEDAAMFNKSE
jgi:hypothetical protein